jgi:DNA-binding transcriptional regulator GbsR (MarR family)
MAQDEIETAELRVAEVIGQLMEFWGFKAVMGRLWTMLYLSPEPLSAAELGERLSLSTGAISMALSDLQKWGVVKKTWRPGERRDFYEPETSIWKMVSRVFRERELGYVREAIEAFQDALARVAQARAARGASADEKKRLKFIEGRLQSLLNLSRIGEGLIQMLLSGESVARPIRSLFEPEE